ncbi:hypothetical protein H5T53_06410 [Candidatus Bipolaricaulota bacterium]|nr:hypothetical protein [Candidatus Bipolaricaulota bacterium]
MRTGVRVVLAVGVVLSTGALSGCFLNVFQTAQILRHGDVAFTVGMAVLDLAPAVLTPQGRLAVGLSDGVEFGVQAGGMVNPGTGGVGFLGAIAELKLSLVDQPDALALAVGVGGGWSVIMGGWGLQASLYLDSNLWFLPLYVAYRPILPLGAEEFAPFHQLAGGLCLDISDKARLLLEADFLGGLWSPGLALEVQF